MTFDEIKMVIGGAISLIFGVWLLSYNISETKRGYKSLFGSDIKLYTASIGFIALGCTLVYRALI